MTITPPPDPGENTPFDKKDIGCLFQFVVLLFVSPLILAVWVRWANAIFRAILP